MFRPLVDRLGLADHEGTQCNEGTLMADQDVDRKATDNPCYLGPTAADRDGVSCVAYDWCDSAPQSGDLDGDGRTDLLHTRTGGPGRIFYANVDGTFTQLPWQPWAGYGMHLGEWRVGDFNGDGSKDLLHLCCPNYGNIFLATPTRAVFSHVTFEPWAGYGMRQGLWRVADFDADGRSDLAHLCCVDVANIFYSNGGTSFGHYAFQPWPTYGMQLGVWLTGNINGSGGADLVHLCCQNSGNLFYFTSRGAYLHQGFQPSPIYGMQQGIWQIGRMNSDATDDLLHVCCTNYSNIFYFGTGGTFSLHPFQPWPTYGMQMGQWRIANLDGAFGGDIIHLWGDSHANLFYSTSTNGSFTLHDFAPAGAVRSVRWRDGLFNAGNFRRDLVQVCCTNSGNVWLSNAIQGTFSYVAFNPGGAYPMQSGKWR